MRRLVAACAALVVALGAETPAWAWGAEGHQYVGNLAFELLNESAHAQVLALLGRDAKGRQIDLGTAAVWPDCLRSVSKTGAKTWSYSSSDRLCAAFGGVKASKAEMEAYVGRNWSNCVYAGKEENCHKAFHFSGVDAFHHTDYRHAEYAQEDSDVVWGIRAAITKLQCPDPRTDCAVQGPFQIESHREALFLLAHLVGDVHQPLHVGALFLDANNQPGVASDRKTIGGNILLLTPGRDKDNLHHAWDTIDDTLGVAPSPEVIKAACARMGPANADLDRPAAWAGESVAAALPAYQTLTFSADPTPGFKSYRDVTFADRKTYDWARGNTQSDRLVAAGVRLAEVLNAIWPSAKPVKACL